MSRAIRSITRSVRGVVDSFTGRSQEDLIKEQRKAEEERIRKEEEERRKLEEKQMAEAEYQKQLEAQKEQATQTDSNIDNTNVGLGDVKVDFGKLVSQEEDEDKLKKALR